MALEPSALATDGTSLLTDKCNIGPVKLGVFTGSTRPRSSPDIEEKPSRHSEFA